MKRSQKSSTSLWVPSLARHALSQRWPPQRTLPTRRARHRSSSTWSRPSNTWSRTRPSVLKWTHWSRRRRKSRQRSRIMRLGREARKAIQVKRRLLRALVTILTHNSRRASNDTSSIWTQIIGVKSSSILSLSILLLCVLMHRSSPLRRSLQRRSDRSYSEMKASSALQSMYSHRISLRRWSFMRRCATLLSSRWRTFEPTCISMSVALRSV